MSEARGPETRDQPPGSEPASDWSADMVAYRLHVHAFRDADRDGIGDLRGLVQGLGYIRELGVNTIWLAPFQPSPMRDGGYDIADHRDVHPAYGRRRDLGDLVRAAHRHGLRVIADLVIGCTSDQHPWFQTARRASPRSRRRHFYVWRTTRPGEMGSDASETGPRWAWDAVAEAYYRYRRHPHEPDLALDRAHVAQALAGAAMRWMASGVDGLCLVAMPGADPAGGPAAVRGVLELLRARIDERWRDRILIGDRDTLGPRSTVSSPAPCDLTLHLELAARLHLALAREDRTPLLDAVRRPDPATRGRRWAIFLRTDGALDLASTSEAEREALYATYAPEPIARTTDGIRRRLAPMMGNDRVCIELAHALLLCLPGAPVLYYGDEIGMGDNVFLGGCDGLRTPMQWNVDRNAGFSGCDRGHTFLPLVQDPVYGYEAVNVEAQARNPSSLLCRLRRLLAIRREHRALSRGTVSFPKSVNSRVLVVLRELGPETILGVFNLSRTPQQIRLDLSAHKGKVPSELLHGTVFTPIGERPYPLLLGPHGFYWIRLGTGGAPGRGPAASAPSSEGDLDFRGDDLSGVDFAQYPRLRGADFSDANLRGVDLRDRDLSGADFRGANLVDAHLDGSTLDGARLWEARRDGWSVRDVRCTHAFWDREAADPVRYEPGAFARLFGGPGARVFLSSTLGDLQGYRDAVYEAVAALEGFECVRMESFGAIGEVPIKVCIDQIRGCDLFVGLLGGRYGSRPPGEQLSFTELEYDAARDKPRLMFLTAEASAPEEDREEIAPQIAFRERVRAEVVTVTFESKATLVDQVVRSLRRWRAEQELVRAPEDEDGCD